MANPSKQLLFCIFLFTLVSTSCLFQVSQAAEPEFTVLWHSMYRDVDKATGKPINPTTKFYVTDEKAYCWLNVSITGYGYAVKVTWRWYDPSGLSYYNDTVSLMGPGVRDAYSPLEIKDTPAVTKTGYWRVEVDIGVVGAPIIRFTEYFWINIPPITFPATVFVSGLPPSYYVNINIDNTPKSTISGGGSKQFNLTLGSTHTIAADAYVSGPTGTRYYCQANSWTVSSESSLTFDYKTQYYLTVKTQYGNVSGESWYDAGSTATFFVKTTTMSGGLLAQYIFGGWSGDLNTTAPTATISMTEPKTVTAIWRADYTQLYIVTGVAMIAVVSTVMALLTSKKVVHRPPARMPPTPMAAICPTCGRSLIYVPQYRRYYCGTCRRYV